MADFKKHWDPPSGPLGPKTPKSRVAATQRTSESLSLLYVSQAIAQDGRSGAKVKWMSLNEKSLPQMKVKFDPEGAEYGIVVSF